MNHKNEIKRLEELETLIGYRFQNRNLLKNALIHSSYVNEVNTTLECNERLEFLGDSVLSLSISTYIYHNFHYREGDSTKLRALVVCERSLAKVANRLNLGSYLFLGKGEEQTGGRERDCILADATEALIAAIYLDSSFDRAYEFVIDQFEEILLQFNSGSLDRDYKSRLQEKLQETSTEVVKYEITREEGPAHDKRYFANAIYNAEVIGVGEGKNKKLAQKSAAEDAYKKMFGKED